MFFKILMRDLLEKNSDFFRLLLKALQFNNDPITAIPSILFLIFSMCIIHRFTHKNLGIHRNNNIYRDALYREIAFQWLYLYLTKIWFYVVKAFRLITFYLMTSVTVNEIIFGNAAFIMNSGNTKPDVSTHTWVFFSLQGSGGSDVNVLFVKLFMFSIFCAVCFTPMFVIIFHFKEEEPQQNFLMWIPLNRWTRSELGTAGRLMERPPNISFATRKNPAAYHAKRSVSTELTTDTSQVDVIRFCRSGSLGKPVSSIDEMTAM